MSTIILVSDSIVLLVQADVVIQENPDYLAIKIKNINVFV